MRPECGRHTPRLRYRGSRLATRLVLIFVLFFALSQPFAPIAQASPSGMYYVDSVSGHDGQCGTMPDTAWRTLAPLHARSFQPGDVIHFRRGSHWHGGLHITSSGLAGQPITYTTYGDPSAPRPIFSNTGEWSTSIRISASWIVLEGVMVRDAHENGVRIERHANHNIVRDIEATDVGIGVGVFGQHNIVSDSLFYDLNMVHNVDNGSDDDWGAVGVVIYNSYNEVSHNAMRGCLAPSYDFGVDGGAVEIYALYGTVKGSRIHGNWSCSNAGFLEIGGVAGSEIVDTEVSYNVSHNGGIFLCMHLDGNFGSTVRDMRVENNTVIEHEGWSVLAFVGGAPTADTMVLRNNVFDIGDYDLFTNREGFARSNNLYNLRNPNTQLGFVPDVAADELLSDPLFMSGETQDYRLRVGSPAIDAGLDLGHTHDHARMPVPMGNAPNMGAYEYVWPAFLTPIGFLPVLIR